VVVASRGLVPSLPKDAWLVLGGDALSAVGSGLTLPFLFVYFSRVRGIEAGTAGLAVATIAVAALLGNPLSGWLSDWFGARGTLIFGLLVAAVGAGLVTLVHAPWQAFAAAGVIGSGAAVIWPSQDALLAQVVPTEERSSVFSVRFATLNAGFGMGALLAAAIVDMHRSGSFVLLYLLDSASFLMFIPILLLLRRPELPSATSGDGPASGYWQVLHDRVFLRVVGLTVLLVTIGYGQYHAVFPGYATRPGGIAAGDLSLAFAANTFTVVAGQLFVLKLLAGRKRTTGIMLATTFWAGAWAVTLAAGRLGGGRAATLAFAAAMVIFAAGETLLSPTVTPIVNDLAPDALRGRYNAVSTLAWTTGFILGPAIGGLALNAGRPEALFGSLVAACGMAVLGAHALDRYLPTSANVVGAPTERLLEPPAPALAIPPEEET
jgi:MFS family permease